MNTLFNRMAVAVNGFGTLWLVIHFVVPINLGAALCGVAFAVSQMMYAYNTSLFLGSK